MDIDVMGATYNTWGGHSTISWGGQFLAQDIPDFGSAIRKIEVTFNFPHSGPALETLEDMLETHREYRKTLPKITFRKAKGAVEIQVASELIDGVMWEPGYPTPSSVELFCNGVRELVDVLDLLKMRLKAKDDFRLEDFLAHCRGRLQHLPATQPELEQLLEGLKAADKARCDALSPWEKLGIDWEDYHPTARDVLNEPFFWDCTDDFAPHGNDTGADVLEIYRSWRKKHSDTVPLTFLEQLAKRWGDADVASMEEQTRREAMVAVAFAQIKLSGTCHAEARKLAEAAINEQRAEALAATNWSHREGRLKSLEKLLSVLKKMG